MKDKKAEKPKTQKTEPAKKAGFFMDETKVRDGVISTGGSYFFKDGEHSLKTGDKK